MKRFRLDGPVDYRPYYLSELLKERDYYRARGFQGEVEKISREIQRRKQDFTRQTGRRFKFPI